MRSSPDRAHWTPIGLLVRADVRLVLTSATILFVELLLIRWRLLSDRDLLPSADVPADSPALAGSP